MMKNAFYFKLIALFVLEIFTVLTWPFGYVEKQIDKKANDNFKTFYVTQSALICSKLTIETLKQGVKYVQS